MSARDYARASAATRRQSGHTQARKCSRRTASCCSETTSASHQHPSSERAPHANSRPQLSHCRMSMATAYAPARRGLPSCARMAPVNARVAVVGHVEWVEFAIVPRLPHPGEILHVQEFWDEAAGGGAVAAVQMAKLAGRATFV